MAALIKHSQKLFRRRHSLSTSFRQVSEGIFRQELEFPSKTRCFLTDTKVRSPFDSNIIRILRTEIDCQSEYAPPAKPPPSFNAFSIEERPGEQFVRLRRKFGEKEDIKIEATMFDGCVSYPKDGEDEDGEDIRLHISVLVDIYKGEGSDGLGFVCSAWPDGLKIMKVYRLCSNGLPSKAYMGPNFGKLDPKVRKALHEYLEARGVNNDLSLFLHHFMGNKDRSELLRWLDTLKSFVEK